MKDEVKAILGQNVLTKDVCNPNLQSPAKKDNQIYFLIHKKESHEKTLLLNMPNAYCATCECSIAHIIEAKTRSE